jgi:hypothetical protein
MAKLGDMFHIPVTDRLNKRRPCVQKTIGRSGTLFCHFLLILVPVYPARVLSTAGRVATSTMAHVVLVRDHGAEVQVLLQRRSAGRGTPVMWGILGGSLEAAEKQHSRGADAGAAGCCWLLAAAAAARHWLTVTGLPPPRCVFCIAGRRGCVARETEGSPSGGRGGGWRMHGLPSSAQHLRSGTDGGAGAVPGEAEGSVGSGGGRQAGAAGAGATVQRGRPRAKVGARWRAAATGAAAHGGRSGSDGAHPGPHPRHHLLLRV